MAYNDYMPYAGGLLAETNWGNPWKKGGNMYSGMNTTYQGGRASSFDPAISGLYEQMGQLTQNLSGMMQPYGMMSPYMFSGFDPAMMMQPQQSSLQDLYSMPNYDPYVSVPTPTLDQLNYLVSSGPQPVDNVIPASYLPGSHVVTGSDGSRYNISNPGGGTNTTLANYVNTGNWAALAPYKI